MEHLAGVVKIGPDGKKTVNGIEVKKPKVPKIHGGYEKGSKKIVRTPGTKSW